MLVLFALSFIIIGCEKQKPRKPAENRFTKVVLAENIDQPMEFEILEDGRVLFVEREGKVKVYDPSTQQVNVIANIPVSTGYYSETGEVLQPIGEDGMQGVVLDPDFEQNHWIYLYYSPKEGNSGSILTRYEWAGEKLNMDSKKVLLKVPNQRRSCCHLGGGMVFDSDGNLYLSTGDNTPNDPHGYTPIDERKGRSRFDSQRSSGNTNDLRGAIIRIHPENDGTYSIPKGNLFPKGTPKTRPEIYTMGNRNPYRLSIDSKTGWLYWGEVGPAGTVDSVGHGPKSYDEFNQARRAGNYGWPYFIADNLAYWEYDYVEERSGEQYNPVHPMNNSPNNDGLKKLPPAHPAFIWYPQTSAEDFPIPGSGSNSALGGPVYRRADFDNPKRPFPLYYEGKWFITDWSRGWIMAVTVGDEGNYKSMERFLPELTLEGPNDMDFGPEGDLYVLEYGRGPYIGNSEAKLIRIEYNKGNRKPIVKASADKTAGSVPLQVQLSSTGTQDYDEDPLNYKWTIISKKSGAGETQIYHEPNPVITLSEPGEYKAVLTVSDSQVTQASEPIELLVGNAPPVVQFDFHGANKSFQFPGKSLDYTVTVSDNEDGSLAKQEISPSEIALSIDSLSSNFDLAEIKQSLRQVNALEPLNPVIGRKLINESDCKACHKVNTKTIGPAFRQIAKKYERQEDAKSYLANKITSGGNGVWGNIAMPPHPTISEHKVDMIVDYILGLQDQSPEKTMPLDGTYTVDEGSSNKTNGTIIFRASYTDKGNNGIPPLFSSDIVFLRDPAVAISEADKMEGIILQHHIGSNPTVTPGDAGSYLTFNNIDLTGIKRVELMTSSLPKVEQDSKLVIEVRIDSATGKVIGKTPNILSLVNNKSNDILSIQIDSIQDRHDLYVLFTGTKGAVSFEQLEIKKIKFIPE